MTAKRISRQRRRYLVALLQGRVCQMCHKVLFSSFWSYNGMRCWRCRVCDRGFR